MQPSTALYHIRYHSLPPSTTLLPGVSDAELAILTPRNPGSRVFIVQTWMFRLMTNRLLSGGLAIPPPLLSRTYQVRPAP